MREGAEIRARASTQGGDRARREHTLRGEGVGGEAVRLDAMVCFSLRLLEMSSPRFPQEEETLSFIRDSLEKSDQLTKNMVSNPSGGRARQVSRPWGRALFLAVTVQKARGWSLGGDGGNVRVSVATVWVSYLAVFPFSAPSLGMP